MLGLTRIIVVAWTLLGALGLARADDIVEPNPNLHIEGIPPIPRSLAARAEKYTEFRPRSMVDWHPVAREIVVASRLGATTQLYRVRAPMAALEALTDYPDPVRQGRYQPKAGKFLVFGKDTGGNEASQLYRLDLGDDRTVKQLTDPQLRHQAGPWNRKGDRFVLLSTPLDKTGRREQVTSELAIADPLRPDAKRALASLPGGGWYPIAWSHDDRRLVVENYISAVQSELWLVDVASGKRERLLPVSDAAAPARYDGGLWASDDKGLFIATSRDGEFRQLAYVPLDTLEPAYLTRDLPWDVEDFDLSEDGARLAVVINEAGRSVLRLFDAATRAPVPLPAVPAGQVGALRWRPGSHELAFTLNSAQSPGDVYSIDTDAKIFTRWTETKVEGIDIGAFRDAQAISWKSFDGRTIHGHIVRPPAKFTGRRPVLMEIHGGPEGQARPGFLGRWNYFVNELGIAVVEPNVRGSSGFGKTYLNLDNGVLREDAVKDIGALFDWIAEQPDLDAKRIVVAGGSYGGYMSLAVATHYTERIAGSIDVVGIANFVSFLERTESYRRDLRRVEYGDERDPKMRAFLEKISPLASAAKIKKPLFVVHGRNDPRVPIFEAEQIITKAREKGTTVWSLIADDEGHGFARKPNADYYFYAMVLFLERYLLENP